VHRKQVYRCVDKMIEIRRMLKRRQQENYYGKSAGAENPAERCSGDGNGDRLLRPVLRAAISR
jgi:hypothetical protein